jgi:general secretion pathway protein K
MPLNPLKNDRGIAILITLSVITILIATALELNRKVRASVIATATARDRLILNQMASSGVNAAMAMLIKDKTTDPNSDSLQEDWANPEKIEEVLQSIRFDSGKISVEISDVRSMIQANALVKFPEGREFNYKEVNGNQVRYQWHIWDRFLQTMKPEDEELDENYPSSIINAVKDWLDSGDDDASEPITGAESDYYQGLDPPYECRNGPFTHLDELAMVKGVTPMLFYGVEDVPEDVPEDAPKDTPKDASGIRAYMTVFGMSRVEGTTTRYTYDGKININTAKLPVLNAIIPTEDEALRQELALSMDEYRQEKGEETYLNDLTRPEWYKNVPNWPADITLNRNVITIKSDIYRIEATAALNEMILKVIAVVQRETDKSGKDRCRVLSWQLD